MFKLLVLALVATAVLAAPSSKIETRLANTLKTKGTANILVTMQETTDAVLSKVSARSYLNHEERVTVVAHALMDFAAVSQKKALTVLENLKADHEVFWISNQIYVRNADAALVQELAAVENVGDISEEFEVKLQPIIEGTTNVSAPGILAEWGVENIEAPAAWALPGGNNGAGVRIAGIDTGCLPTHVDLVGNFYGNNYGWRDTTAGASQVARDGNGHGTHTIGTIVGANGIGVAPGATWMACKGLNDAGSGTNAGLISCGQWVACPTLPNGNSPDCTRAPHVVSNSWGGGQGNTFYNAVINAWHAANIIPVFANGNSGPNCGTANSPADSTAGVIGVGATANPNSLASFSSKGPTSSGNRVKPDISAPGQNVRSAWHTGASAYNTISGTSMACPHVAGVVALLKSRNSALNYAQITNLLYSTTNRNIVQTGRNCGSISEAVFPNNAFGYGIVNARAALQQAIGG